VPSENKRYDYAFIVIARNGKGRGVEDAVGGLPIGFNQPRGQPYRLLGLPGEPTPPYDGQRPFACDTAYAGDVGGAAPGPPMMAAGCDFKDGSSGGPWLSGAGAVTSVISGGVPAHPDVIYGPYLDSDAASLFAAAGNVSTIVKKKCKKGKRLKKGKCVKKKRKKKKR
jgi:hypothetical protein